MQDVLPPNERSIRNIPVAPGRRRFSTVPQMPGGPAEPPSDSWQHDDTLPERPRRTWLLWGAAVVVVFILLGILASTFFEGATITVYPKTAEVALPSSVLAALDAPVGSLAFQTMAVSAFATRTVPASGTTPVTRQAFGAITVYNAYSTASQKLIANTRFEAPDGKIYRIRESITVPGETKKSDGTYAAGAVSATVYADSPGPDYNRGSTRFTIPGFKGDPRYTKFYATADSILGGASGTEPAVSQSDLANAKKDMQQELTGSLASNASGQLPKGFLPIPGAFAIAYGDVSVSDAGGGKATITEAATATAAIVRSSDLANAIAKAKVDAYAGEAVDFADPSAVTLAATGTPFAAAAQTLTIALSGTPKLVWQFDPGALSEAFAGKDKGLAESLAADFKPAIDHATASIRPFWKSSFPSDPARIHITVKIQ